MICGAPGPGAYDNKSDRARVPVVRFWIVLLTLLLLAAGGTYAEAADGDSAAFCEEVLVTDVPALARRAPRRAQPIEADDVEPQDIVRAPIFRPPRAEFARSHRTS